MKDRVYKLFGFATGSAEAPQFMIPVFQSDAGLFVQSFDESNDTVICFVEFYDDIEIIESDNSETIGVGDRRMFAVRDSGDRVVRGDRDFVSKYLKQNMRKFIDKPYFLFESIIFSGQWIAESQFIKSYDDLLEAAVLCNSVRRFCITETEKYRASAKNKKYIKANAVESESDVIRNILFNSHSESVFDKWLKFAGDDAQKLVNQSKWKHLSNNHYECFAGDRPRARRYTILYWVSAKYILDSAPQVDFSGDFSVIKYRVDRSAFYHAPMKDLSDNVSDDIPLRYEMIVRGTKRIVARKQNRSSNSKLTYLANWVSRKIKSAISEDRVSQAEVSRSVYFVTLIMNFISDLDHNKKQP